MRVRAREAMGGFFPLFPLWFVEIFFGLETENSRLFLGGRSYL